MKKIFFLFILMFFITSCGSSQSDIDTAKDTLLNPDITQETVSVSGPDIVENTGSLLSEEILAIEIKALDTSSFLEIDPLNIKDFLDGEAEISGTTLTSVDKIEVDFSNKDSQFPADSYTLKTFKSWDTRFKYNASSGFKVLDFGDNTYTFRAFSGIETSEIQVIVRVPEEGDEDNETPAIEQISTGTQNVALLSGLPTSSKYGDPISLGETSFTYSQIKSLEVEKKLFPAVTCETLATYLSESQNSWFYWNTCRDIVKEKGIKFNLIRLEWENYIYERHYIDFEHSFYGTYELERGTGITKDTIQEKNTQLKDQVFPTIEVVDDLMRDIVNS